MADFNLEDIATRPELIREIAGTTGLIALTLDERDALVAIARWAQDTPHHDRCLWCECRKFTPPPRSRGA